MRRLPTSVLYQFSLILGGFLFALALQSLAFTEPSSNPPAGDVSAPINTGPTSQDKSGGGSAWITADGLGSRYGALLATVSGNVGIGTTSPQYPLDIQMNGATPVVALRANNNADLQWYRNGAGSGTYMWDLSNRGTNSSPSDNLQLYTNGSNPIMTWQQNGNVGIGTTNPTARLTVRQSSDSQGALPAIAVYNTAGTAVTQLMTGGDNNSYLFNGTGGSYMVLTSSGSLVTSGGTIIYSCPSTFPTTVTWGTCAGELSLSSTCSTWNTYGDYTGTQNCTPVGHLVL